MEGGGLTLPLLRADGMGFDCKAVLFDKDGTLIDFKDMWLEWSRYMLDEVSAAAGFKNGERDILERAMGIDLAAWHVDPDGPLAGGSMTGLRESMLQMLQTTGRDEDDAHSLLHKIIRQAEEVMDWETLATPVPGLYEMLDKLHSKGFKLAVVTADYSGRAKISLAALKLIDCFDVVLGADSVQKSKPAPDLALLACRELGVKPGRAVVVGDTPRDILMAKVAGTCSIGVLSGVSTREQLTAAEADAVIGSVSELGV